jgi:hypothetical protein
VVEVSVGFFDFLTGGGGGPLKKHCKRMKNLNAQAEERMISAEWLADEGSEEAILGLLGRFTVTYEHRMKDSNEKDAIYGLLRDMGPKVCDPIRAWVRKHDQFAVPLRIVDEFDGKVAAVDVLLDMLGREVDPFKPEKKRQILIRLAEYQDDRIVARVPAVLHDFDEGVRYAAAEALLCQETDAVREELAAALASREEESNRLRVRLSEAFHKRGWTLTADQAEAVAERPPHGWEMDGLKLRPA